jgi:hypothetical protein
MSESESESQSHIATDGQSVSMSWCQLFVDLCLLLLTIEHHDLIIYYIEGRQFTL